VAEPGENPRFRFLTVADDGDVSYVLEGIIKVKLLPLTSRGNPRSMDRMMPALIRRLPP
jgi:hypothetical protein